MIKTVLLLLILILLTLYSFKGQDTPQSSQATRQILNQGCQPADPSSSTVDAFAYQLTGKLDEDEGKNPDFRLLSKGVIRNINQPKIAYIPIVKNVALRINVLDKTLKKVIDDADGGLLLESIDAEIVKVSGQDFQLYYPSQHGTIEIEKTGGIDKIKPAKYGLIFLAHLNKNNAPLYIKIEDRTRTKKGNYIIVDVYQNPNIQFPSGILESLIKECQGLGKEKNQIKAEQPTQTTESPPEIIFPDQAKSDDKKQLQLEYFVPQKGALATSVRGVWAMHCKPAIYLYPKEKTQVNVKVKTKGFLTYTDPKYPEGGWNVIAHPDGRIYDLRPARPAVSADRQAGGFTIYDRPYPYLYYESKVPDKLIEKPKDGYVVEYAKLPKLYDLLLPQLGLDQNQTADFKDYWQKALPYSAYYFVGVMSQKNIDEFEPLEINPQPDLSIRVRVYFEALTEKPTNLLTDPNSLIINHKSSIINPAFKLIEWGGMVKNSPLEPFTCSQ